MNSKNDAEQIVFSLLDGANGADVKMAVIPKYITFTIADGATDYEIGDEIYITLTKNPPASAITYKAANTGTGTTSVGALVGDVPDEVLTLRCTAKATDLGTFSVTGSKSGKHDDATVATAYTLKYQEMEVGDQIIAALSETDGGGAVLADVKDTVYVVDGGVKCTADLNGKNLHLLWRDRSAG